jgi:hypothetical protein
LHRSGRSNISHSSFHPPTQRCDGSAIHVAAKQIFPATTFISLSMFLSLRLLTVRDGKQKKMLLALLVCCCLSVCLRCWWLEWDKRPARNECQMISMRW